MAWLAAKTTAAVALPAIKTSTAPARPAMAAVAGRAPSPARNRGSGVSRNRIMRINSGPVVAEANTTAEIEAGAKPEEESVRHQSSCPAVARLETVVPSQPFWWRTFPVRHRNFL